MGDNDQQTQDALERINGVEKRLAALQELGLDTAGLRSQLAFAQTRLLEGAVGDVDRICEEVIATARRMAQGGSDSNRVRTGRITRDELADEIRQVLGKGLFAKLLAEHQGGGDPRTEARLAAFDANVREYLQANHRKAEENLNQVRGDLHRVTEMLRGEIAMIRRVPNEPVHIVGFDHAVETMSGRQQEGAAALATAVEELGERLAERLAQAQAEQVRQTEALVGAVREQIQAMRDEPAAAGSTAITVLERIAAGLERQSPQAAATADAEVTTASEAAPLADEVRALTRTLGERLDKGEGIAQALRDGLAAVGQAMAAPHGDIEKAETRATLQAGFERIAQALESRAAAGATAAPLGDELKALEESFSLPAAAVDQGISEDQTAAAISTGFRELVAALATLKPGEPPPAVAWNELVDRLVAALSARGADAPASAPATDGAMAAAVSDGFRSLTASLAECATVTAPDSAGLRASLDEVCARLDSTRERVAASIEAGLAKVAEALASRPSGTAAEALASRPAGIAAETEAKAVTSVEGDDIPPLAPNTARPSGYGSRGATQIISENDSTRFAHQVTTGHVAASSGAGGGSVSKVGIARLRNLVEEEIRNSLAGMLRNQLVQLLPEILKDPAISQQICGLIALEAVSHPGVLGELTGLRSFLRRELKIAVEALAKDLQPV